MAFEGLGDKLGAVFKRLKSRGKLNQNDIKEVMREVRLALLEADVNYKVAKDFVSNVSERCLGAQVMQSLTPAQQVIKIVNEELVSLMGESTAKIKFASKGPTVVMMCGLQGSGKTTHSAKLALHYKNQGKRPLLVACDIYRPAAIEQLKIVGQKVGVSVFELGQQKPLKIAKEAIRHAKDHGNDLVILDTAGRLHIDEELMNELKEIKREIEPDEILFVVDSMMGQDAVNVSKAFDEALGIDGVILTKLDGDTRGGAALSIRAVTGKPIKFIGVGEKLGDLEAFHPDRMASRILGMGDMLTLIEKAQTEFDEKQAEEMEKKLLQNSFDLNDLLAQMSQIKKMGSLSQIIGMLPGGNKINPDDIDDKALLYTEALILSMTPKERKKPSIINPSRKRRIAAGSGLRVEDVNRLLKQFEQMQKMMKQFNKKGKRMPSLPGMGMGNNPFGF